MKSSMYSSKIAEPYAQALMGLAQQQNLTEAFGEDLRSILALLKESPDLAAALSSPVVKDEDKKSVLRSVMGEGGNGYLINFLMLLVDKRRIIFLEAICEQYLVLLRQFTNTVLAEVTSALKLTDAQKDQVKEKVKQLTGAQSVELVTKIDGDILGGIVIKVGSQVFDSSLRGQLRRVGLSLGTTL
ncbi:F0F1 ATP synthase subunit delta [Synechocystis sp. LEGE 06083]|uniref:ATP synthase F1 subunit delta n=1 Tax=Synechocystis sp. LEGE 06083 TaxID=915336 RepID=UPI00187FBBB1|nr:ATP synthase F1 subunit delta [Synechocystis sp. LEGE 06083]MBE9197117.1 F0F1 ATP synthase subunit delta [Synechocystis sp. LEGE 06083]